MYHRPDGIWLRWIVLRSDAGIHVIVHLQTKKTHTLVGYYTRLETRVDREPGGLPFENLSTEAQVIPETRQRVLSDPQVLRPRCPMVVIS